MLAVKSRVLKAKVNRARRDRDTSSWPVLSGDIALSLIDKNLLYCRSDCHGGPRIEGAGELSSFREAPMHVGNYQNYNCSVGWFPRCYVFVTRFSISWW